MINLKDVKKYCKDYTKIENYELAMADSSQTWECHHKLEIGQDYLNTCEELKMMNLYYNRPAEELIFLTVKEHHKVHRVNHAGCRNGMYGKDPWNLGTKHSEETRKKISKSMKGKAHKHTDISRNNISNSHIKSEFGLKYKEHYNKTKREDLKLYVRESYYYKKFGKCSWE